MQTSPQGISFIERHEGVVLRAYRDVAGVWTIGAGLTKGSGVVAPAAGMVITAAEASRLMALALRRNYEPAVARAMPGTVQHEFDAGVSFHYNTGAIGRASWVGKWRARDWPGTRTAIRLWNKAGGKILQGLIRRRDEEYALLSAGDYGAVQAPPSGTGTRFATFAPPLSGPERDEIRAALASLGFAAGQEETQVDLGAVRLFQTQYGLTVDGIVGPATRAAITRAQAARVNAAGSVAVTGAGAGGELFGNLQLEQSGVWLIAIPGLIWLGWTAWQYRDALAAHMPRRIATFLRSF